MDFQRWAVYGSILASCRSRWFEFGIWCCCCCGIIGRYYWLGSEFICVAAGWWYADARFTDFWFNCKHLFGVLRALEADIYLQISPSSNNAICGIKPTVGLTSRHLVIPISQTQDTLGSMAGDCKTAAAILSVIAGKDPLDNYTSAIPFDEIPDYAAACMPQGLKGARIGTCHPYVRTQSRPSLTIPKASQAVSSSAPPQTSPNSAPSTPPCAS